MKTIISFILSICIATTAFAQVGPCSQADIDNYHKMKNTKGAAIIEWRESDEDAQDCATVYKIKNPTPKSFEEEIQNYNYNQAYASCMVKVSIRRNSGNKLSTQSDDYKNKISAACQEHINYMDK